MWLRVQPPFRTALLWCFGSPQDGSIICVKYHRSKLGYVRLASRWCDLWPIFQQIQHKPKPIQKWIKMHSFVPRSMWNGPQNKPQGRQCVTHRRPQNLCLKRVPKMVPMKAQNVGTVPDKLPIFHCHFFWPSHRHLWQSLENMAEKSLKQIWHVFKTIQKHYQGTLPASLNNLKNVPDTFLKHVSNISVAYPKHHCKNPLNMLGADIEHI